MFRSATRTMDKSVKNWSNARLATTAAIAAAAWYVTNYVMSFLNLVFFVKRGGGTIDYGRLDFASLWSDTIGWSHYVGAWLSLTIPILVVLVIACARIKFSWKIATWIGLAIALTQIVIMLLARIFTYHNPPFASDYVIYYMSRFWIVMPGVFASAGAWKLDLGTDILSA